MKRQRGRNRGPSSGGNQKPTQNANRAFDSNGPDGVKVRGNAQHVFEKYQQLARDAGSGGDRVLAENYLQHAEHYFRLLRALQPSRSASEIIGRDQFQSGYDIDFEDESGQAQAIAADEAAAESGENRDDGEARDQNRDQNRDRDQNQNQNRDRDRPRGEWQARDRDDRPRDRDDRPRDQNQNRDRDQNRPRGEWQPRDQNRDRDRNRGDRPRDDRPRDDRPRDERPRDDRPRDERPREDRPREDRPQGEERRDRYERDRDERPRDRDPMPVVQPQGDPQPQAPVLRDADGEHSNVPAFLRPTRPARAPAAAAPAVPAAVEAAADDKPKPRRRRAPRSFEAGEGGPSETEEA